MTIYLSPEVKYDYHCTSRETLRRSIKWFWLSLVPNFIEIEEKLENSKVAFIPQT
jgi:hypothetical protein